MGFLYEELETARKYAAFSLPDMISPNLNAAFEMRPYQERAFENFAFWFEDTKNPRPRPSQVLFHMATGSGKTLIMAGLMLYLYKKGYRDFLFFVNLSNIVQKTKENFLNAKSRKFLFAKEINIGGEVVPVKEVENFQDSDPKAINICFTTTQGLHSDIHNTKENAVTIEDFAERKVVLISDEAHHLNADTRKANKEEEESSRSWEETVTKIFQQNAENILLEFTATCDTKNADIKAKYLDKIIFDYQLSEFRKDRYSKEIMTLRTDVSVMDRALLALVMNQYRLKVFQHHRIYIKPVVLFKARTIADSKAFMDEFLSRVAKLTAKDIERLSRLVDNSTLKAAFKYFKDCGLSAADLAQELMLDFAKEHCISANDDKEASERQIALNSLEDADNPYRAVFEVKKLDEGWDVLNLFDIVRLYETRQSGGKSISPTTIAEAQLIGRGSRYCPFVVKSGQDKFRRKYDNDGSNPLRICEELYYHCQIDPKYIAELKSALRQIGAESDPERCEYRLKEIFRKDELYKSGIVFVNEQKEKSRKGVTGVPQYVKDATIEYKTNLGSSRESAVMEDSGTKEDIRSVKPVVTTIAEIAKRNYAFVWRAMCKHPALRFDNLKGHFPELESSRQFIESGDYAGAIRISIIAPEITPEVMCAAAEKAMREISVAVESIEKEYEGTKEFKGRKIKDVITDKTCLYADPETATEGLGVSQNKSARWAIDLTKEDWFAYEDNFGTTEEKNFVQHFKGLVERLKKSFAKIWLVRNERQLCIYSFKDGRRFEPDYILFLKRKKNSRKTEQIQVFVEPKGGHLIDADGWKEDFLLELAKEGKPVFDIADTTSYKIVGCHFYNESDAARKKKIDDSILGLCGGGATSSRQDQGAVRQEVPERLRFVKWLPLYSLKAACGKFGEDEMVEPEGWVEVSGVRRRNENLFAVHAEGNSMEPKIKDGEICVFERREGTCDNNEIVLVEHAAEIGDDMFGSYVIKKFVGVKGRGGRGYSSIRLVPVNEDHDEVKLVNNGRNVRKYYIVGVWRSEVKVKTRA